MTDKKYQTIDPLIMETLNLNQKRIHHIFDILHGRETRLENKHVNRSLSQDESPQNKLPRLLQQHQKAKSPRNNEYGKNYIKKQRESSATMRKQHKKDNILLQDIAQKQENMEREVQAKSLIRQRKSKSQKQQSLATISNLQEQQQQSKLAPATQRRQRLIQDYGMSQMRKNKSLEINPKDIYRIQIQALVAKPLEIEELEDAQKLMKRLKRRYQHLRKFDKHYFSKLCQNQYLLI